MKAVKLLLFFLFFLAALSLGIMFGIENTQEIQLTFFKFAKKYTIILNSPLWIIVGGAFLFGSILAISVCFIELLKLQLSIRHLKKQIRQMSAPVANYYSESEPVIEAQTTSTTVEGDFDNPSESDEIL